MPYIIIYFYITFSGCPKNAWEQAMHSVVVGREGGCTSIDLDIASHDLVRPGLHLDVAMRPSEHLQCRINTLMALVCVLTTKNAYYGNACASKATLAASS